MNDVDCFIKFSDQCEHARIDRKIWMTAELIVQIRNSNESGVLSWDDLRGAANEVKTPSKVAPDKPESWFRLFNLFDACRCEEGCIMPDDKLLREIEGAVSNGMKWSDVEACLQNAFCGRK